LKPALFLDRDGIINIDYGYVSKIENFKFIDEIFDVIKLFQNREYYIFIVTNQSGIGRGYYSLKDFQELTNYMLKEFRDRDILIDDIQYCPHSPEQNCSCRKPNIGMVENIFKKFSVDLANSWLIGDKQSDIDLAKNAKIANTIAVGGKNFKNASFCCSNLTQAKEFIKSYFSKAIRSS